MKIPKKMKLTQLVSSYLNDAAGLLLGEFGCDMDIDPKSKQSTFSMNVTGWYWMASIRSARGSRQCGVLQA